MKVGEQGRKFSSIPSVKESYQEGILNNKDKGILAGNFKNLSGPSKEELIGLNVEDSNKRRRGPNNNIFMEIEGVDDGALPEAGLSKTDCPVKLGDTTFTMGLVLRDHVGALVLGKTVCKAMVSSVFEAEALAVLEGLQWLLTLTYDTDRPSFTLPR
ncbi:hypothetical protein POM88_011034 [Heracleum sosnowskyi]|uniref:RNase H type-1 domain-containing protein n=1 Tax=Heracleum sosnowskyi TaxID=360622 RepID=A0AAD8IVY7_9APIA|nr:hypothetical protein POM88_011034 [Heracleum sosnowskyi]